MPRLSARKKPTADSGSDEETTRLVKAGLPLREVGKRLGVSARTVYRRVVRLGISERRRRRPLTDERIQKVLRLSADGESSVRSIAKAAGIGWHTASRILDDHQEPRNQPPRRCPVCGSVSTLQPCLTCRARKANMSTAVVDFVNLIFRYKNALLHDSDEGGRRFSDDPAIFCTLAISRVHHLSKPALRAVKEAGEVAQFAPLIEQAYFQFVNFCKEAETIPANTPGRLQGLLASEPWQRVQTALDRIAFLRTLLQDESSDGQSIADQLDRGDLVVMKVTFPNEALPTSTPPGAGDASPDQASDTADGPIPPDKFQFKGKLAILKLTPSKVLSAMWGHKRREITDVEDEVWPSDQKDKPPDDIGPTLNRVNVALGSVCYPERIGKKGDYLIWKPA